MPCKYSTILDLWAGSTRENNLALATAAFWSEIGRSSNSRPEYDFPVVSSFSPNTPILRQIASAVACANRKFVNETWTNILNSRSNGVNVLCCHRWWQWHEYQRLCNVESSRIPPYGEDPTYQQLQRTSNPLRTNGICSNHPNPCHLASSDCQRLPAPNNVGYLFPYHTAWWVPKFCFSRTRSTGTRTDRRGQCHADPNY